MDGWYVTERISYIRRLGIAREDRYCVYASKGEVRVARVSQREHASPLLEEKLRIDEKTCSATELGGGAIVTVEDSSKLLMFSPENEALTQAQCAMMLNAARACLGRRRLSPTEVSVM